MAHTHARQSHVLKRARHASVPTWGTLPNYRILRIFLDKKPKSTVKALSSLQTASRWLDALPHLWLHHLSFLLQQIKETVVTSPFWKPYPNAVYYQVVIMKPFLTDFFFLFPLTLIPRSFHTHIKSWLGTTGTYLLSYLTLLIIIVSTIIRSGKLFSKNSHLKNKNNQNVIWRFL